MLQHAVRRREALYTRRKQSVLTQYEVAKDVGIAQSVYSLIETGHSKPSKRVAEKLCKMFDLPGDYFEGDEKGA